jgi:stage V sporulation protein G
MPSRKLTDRCPRCGAKNHLRARFCNDCGAHLQEERAIKSEDGRAKLYADIAHPINSDCRDLIQRRVLESYTAEMERSKLPGYVCSYDDYGEDSYASLGEEQEMLIELPRVIALPDAIRRRDHPAPAAGPHARHAHGNGSAPGDGRLAILQHSAADDESFGDGII